MVHRITEALRLVSALAIYIWKSSWALPTATRLPQPSCGLLISKEAHLTRMPSRLVRSKYMSPLTLFPVRLGRYRSSSLSKRPWLNQIVSCCCSATQSCTSLTTSVSLLYECSPGITVKALRFIAQAISQTNAGPIDVTIRESCSPCPIIWLKSCSWSTSRFKIAYLRERA